MNQTRHFGLSLPEQDDFYDVDVFNENNRRIDALLHELEPQRPKTLIVTYLTSGAFRPADHGLVGKTADIYMVGGGAGAGVSALRGGGGGGGYCRLLRDVVLNQNLYNIVIGAGGASAVNDSASGSAGGRTIAFGAQANGGQPSVDARGGDGGSGGGSGAGAHMHFPVGFDGGSMGSGGSGMGGTGGGNMEFDPVNPYDGVFYGCGGGGRIGGRGGGSGGSGTHALGVHGFLGGGGGGGSTGAGGIPIGGHSTSGGNGGIGGGGGGAGISESGGRGGSGLVYIYASQEGARPASTPLAQMSQVEYFALMDECKEKHVEVGILKNGLCIDVAVFCSIEIAEEFLQASLWPEADGVVELQKGIGIGDKWNGTSWKKNIAPIPMEEEALS